MPLRQRHHISADSWEPTQHIPSLELRKRDNFFSRLCIKFAGEGYFLSQPQSWYAALMEADPDVPFYVPRPIQFRVGSRSYTPPCYVMKNNRKFLVDFITDKTKETLWLADLKSTCELKKITFELISVDWVWEQRQLAENWITITKVIALNSRQNTDNVEFDILQNHLSSAPIAFGDIMSNISSINRHEYELALFRLLHAGRARASLGKKILDFDTEIQSCV